jgi:sugar (pentulose or hexulose) kinase
MSAFFLALDAGTGGGRALICDEEGRTSTTVHRAWNWSESLDIPGASEFDPDALWRTLADAAREALARSRLRPDSIRGICATSFRDGSVLLDRVDRPLLCFTNRDGRSVVQGSRLAEEYGGLIHAVAGRLPFGIDLAEHLIWTRDERPDIFERVAHALSVGDWITFRLCGEFVAEPTNASSTLLLDIRKRAWSREIAEALDLATDLLPPMREPGVLAGELRAKEAEELGLRPGIPVAVGGGDSPLACLGCGALEPGAVVAAAGTTIPVMMVEDEAPFDATRRLWAGAHPLCDRWLLESNGGPAGVAYKWARENLYAAEEYSVMEAEASTAQPGAAWTFLGPHPADFSQLSFPRPLAIVIPSVLGFGPAVNRGQLARAVLENIGYAVWANAEQLRELSKRPIGPIYLCGGVARSETFVQVLAATANVPLLVGEEPEAAALGAAICAAVGARVHQSLRAAADTMTHATTVEPQTELVSRYSGLYRKWLKMLPKVEALR